MAKKRRTRDKRPSRPRKKKYTNAAHFFYRDQIAPLEKAYRQLMRNKQYKLAGEKFLQARALRSTFRNLLARGKKVPIN